MKNLKQIIERLPDGAYWKVRHAGIFLINLPFMPVILFWNLLREVFDNFVECFTCNGSKQIEPFWRWEWME